MSVDALKHTPGPWRYSTEPQPNGCPIIGARGLMIAMLAHSVHSPDQKETAIANAELIASAPEMSERIAHLEKQLGRLTGWLSENIIFDGQEDWASCLNDGYGWIDRQREDAHKYADSLVEQNSKLKKALEFYADSEIYKPHPHGIAFDRRDLSYHAKLTLEETK